MRLTTSLPVVVAVVVLAGVAHSTATGQAGEPKRKIDRDVVFPEQPESTNAEEREVRTAKNTRYNRGGIDLTVELPPDSEIFAEHIWPAVKFIPVEASAVVVVGRVTKVQPYLSTDRSRIYTEISIAVDDVIKQDHDKRVSDDKTVVVDRLGGALKLKTGRVARDKIVIDYLGDLEVGRRYVVFAQAVNDGEDVSLLKSYELVDGKVFTNDTRRSRLVSTVEGVPSTWGDEAAFLKAVREATASIARNAKRRSN